jgi:hypothetical protein
VLEPPRLVHEGGPPMKKLLMLAFAGMFSASAAAYACDGMKKAKADKAGQTAKADKAEKAKTDKKS